MVAESTDHVILLHRAALPTMARIERDRARVSNPRLQSLLSTMATHLFDPDFNVEVLKQRSQMADNNLSAMLNARLGVGLHAYIEARRIDTAEVLMRDTSLKLNTISALVGYTHPSVFSRAFLRARGERPSARRRRLRQQHLERDASAMPAPYALAPLRAPTCRATCADCSCPLDGASAMHVWRALEPLCPLCAQADPHMPRPLLTALALTPGAIVRRRLALPVRGVLPHPDPKRPQLPPAEHARLVEQLMICIDAIGGPAIDLWRQGGPVTPIARPGVAAPLATPTPFDDSPAIRGAAEAMCRRLYAWLAGRDLPSALAALTDDALPPAAAADSRPLRDALADVVAHRADRSTAQSPTAGHRRALEQIDAADDALLRLMLERARAVGQPAHVDRAAAFVERWIERAVTSGHPLAADRAQALRALAVVCRVEARVRCGEDDGAAATDLRLANADLLLSGSGNSDAPHHLDLAAQ
ncbi:MAG: helix-turn-helix domain-containing protein, partial [Acidobacteriota bacterium]